MEPITITIPGLKQIFGAFHPPLSTNNTIIFPFNSSSKKFTRGTYSAKLTKGRASVDDINQVFTLFELILSRLDSNLRLIGCLLLRILIPYWTLWLIYEFYWFDYSVFRVLRTFYPWYLVIMVGLLIADRTTQKMKAKADMNKLLEMIGPAYAKRGLSWHISDEFFSCWLELRKESQKDEEETVQITSQQSTREKLLVDFEKGQEEDIKYSSPILTYELSERENHQ